MKIGTLIGGITILLVAVFIILTPINTYPEAGKWFSEETNLELPIDSKLLLDEKEIFGDAFRKALFTSSKELTNQLKRKLPEAGFETRKPQDVGTMFFMPEEMKNNVQKDELLEFYRTDGPKTVVVVLSNDYLFMWEAWI